MATELEARLDRLEAEFRLLEKELAQLRTLVAVEQLQARVEEERRHARVPRATVAAPSAPPSLPPERQAVSPVVPRAAHVVQPSGATPDRTAAPAPPAPPKEPVSRAPAIPREPRRSLRRLAEDWDLIGPRGFAIVGGAVLALGIGFFFVLAANRGWIDERARIAFGATASALAVGAGLWLHGRYGQYWAALGAAGAGIAGAYATLAAATARYDLVPDALGLPLAGVIAAVGTAIAIRWRSETIAAIGLLGAALAPALQAIDTGMAWESVAFALIVLVATAAVAIPRAWHTLLHVATAVVGVQGLWLVSEVGVPADTGTIAATAALAATLLGIAVGLQLSSARADLEPVALTYALLALGVPLATASQLFDERTDRGLSLVGVSAVWFVALGVLAWRRKPDLALVVGTSALALTVLGTALLLSDSALSIAWSVEAVLFALLAVRFADARLELSAIAYATLASGAALGTVGWPMRLFDRDVVHLDGVLPLIFAAAALAAAGLGARASYVVRTETGLLAFVGAVRRALEAQRSEVREVLFYTASAFATISEAFALVSISFDWGHVAATALAALVGALLLGIAGALRRDGLAVAAYIWLGVVLVVAIGFDVPEFYEDATDVSIGGWSLIAAAAGMLGGAYAHRVLSPSERLRDVVAGIAFLIAVGAGALGVGFVSETRVSAGLGLLVEAAVLVALAAGVFRRPGFRNVATMLWSLALVVLLGAEGLLVTDSVWRAVLVAATAVGVAILATPLGEQRLWLAGGALAVSTTVVVLLIQVQPWLETTDQARRLAIASGACAFATMAVAALRWGEARWRDLVTTLWVVAILAVLASEHVLVTDTVWLAAVVAATAVVLGLLASPLHEERLWLAGAALAVATTAAVLLVQARPWLEESEFTRHLAIATAACALAAFGVSALRWRADHWRDLVTVVWVTGILALLSTERIVLGDFRATAIAFALTGGALTIAAHPLRESRVWTAGIVLVGVTLAATLAEWTPPSHLLRASESPADGVWVLLACLAGLAAASATMHERQVRVALEIAAGSVALYALSLGILDIAERVSTASIETDFERGHTAVSGLWALVGLALLVAGLLRGSSAIRYAGLALFGLSLAKIFLYDLASLSSVARAFSFILVGGLLLAGGFFLQRLSDHLGPPRHP